MLYVINKYVVVADMDRLVVPGARGGGGVEGLPDISDRGDKINYPTTLYSCHNRKP